MLIPPINFIESNNFHNAWVSAVKFCNHFGIPITFGDRVEPKEARDSCQLISLMGDAIAQIEAHEIHPKFPFRLVKQYCDEFTREYLEKYLKMPWNQKFTYLYLDRLVNYDCAEYGITDQLSIMKDQLQDQIEFEVLSNRCQAITWYPEQDSHSNACPCLQRLWIRYIGDNQVDVHYDWRSRDLISAWQVNIIALTECLNREIIWPNNCKIARIVDYSDSLHIYDSMQNVIQDDLNFVPITQWR